MITGFVKNPGHGTKFSPDVNDSENTETICVKNSVANTFRTGQTTTTRVTLDDLDTIQFTANDSTGKLPNSGPSKTTICNNNKSLHRLRIPQLEVFSLFISVLYNLTILTRMMILHLNITFI